MIEGQFVIDGLWFRAVVFNGSHDGGCGGERARSKFQTTENETAGTFSKFGFSVEASNN